MSDETEWVLVPRDATPEMWEAGMNCHSPDDTQGDYLEKAWSAMLAAAPQPPAEAQAQVGGEEGFKAWVVEQMPAGTVIDNPAWWADRLAQAYAANVPQPPSVPEGVEDHGVESPGEDPKPPHTPALRWLAEALRDALECGEDGDWQSARNYINEALRDHDQEGKDG